MLARLPLMRLVAGGTGIPGQHVREHNAGFLHNDGERYRAKAWISTGFVDSTVHQRWLK
jgi:hypothetical protein